MALPPVACRYEIRLTDRSETPPRTVTSHWLFWRSERMIQTADGSGERGEIWELDGSGQIFYRKLYHGKKTAVEYLPSDSVVDHLRFDWARLSSLVDPASLERLNLEGAASFAGRPAERRSGWHHGHRTELLWLPVERLPARLSKSDGR